MIKYVPFSSVLSKVIDNRGRTCPTAATGTPLIATNCVTNNNLYPTYDTVRYVDDETMRTWFRGHPLPGDLLFVLKGTPGRVALVPDPVDFCIAQDMVALRADPNKIYPRYLFAVLRSEKIQQEIEGLHVGSFIPHFKKSDFNELKIPVVNEKLQEFIGDQYLDFSLKIDLLTRQNETLEDLAQAYFRKWFVDETIEDWEEKGLDEIADFLNGLPLQKYPYKSGKPMNVIKIKELNSGYSENTDSCSSDVPEKYIVHPGDVIFSWSGSLVVDIWKYGEGALNQHLFKVTSDKYPKWFYYFWIKYHLPEFRVIAESKATTMGHIQRSHLSAARVLVPSDDEIKTMGDIMQPLIEKIEHNNAQILTLQKLRDTLLPKLISGEVRVKL